MVHQVHRTMKPKSTIHIISYFSIGKGLSTGSIPQSLIVTSLVGRSLAPVDIFSISVTTSCTDGIGVSINVITDWEDSRSEVITTYHSFEDLPEHNMAAIQPLGLHSCDEELGAIGVFAGIGHAHPPRTLMLQLEVLIRKFVTINTFTCTAEYSNT